jgi:hypothetical protein
VGYRESENEEGVCTGPATFFLRERKKLTNFPAKDGNVHNGLNSAMHGGAYDHDATMEQFLENMDWIAK